MKWFASATVLLAGCGALAGVDFGDAQLGGLEDDGGAARRRGCVPAACNGQCGAVPDGCGGELRCADCGAGEQCGAQAANRCGVGTCTPKTCASVAGACGRTSDGCGNVLECPVCSPDRVPCPLPWDSTLLLDDGASIQAFENAVVPFRTTCNSETRTCTRGVLSGSFGFGGCGVAPPSTCAGPSGTVEHGASVTAYAAEQVAWNATCQSQQRTCDDGALSGSFAHASCTVAPPPGFSCPDTALVRATAGCGIPPPQGPFFVHQIRCSAANVLTDTVQVIPSGGGGATNYNYGGGTQAFSLPCVPGGAPAFTMTCQPVDAVIRCTLNATTFDLPQQ